MHTAFMQILVHYRRIVKPIRTGGTAAGVALATLLIDPEAQYKLISDNHILYHL